MSNLKIPKIYIICLEKTKSKRCLPTLNAWKKVSHNIQTVQAITPQEFNLKDVVTPYTYAGIQNRNRKSVELLGAPVEAACGLSHIKTWRLIAESQEPGIILEDDMDLPEYKIRMLLNQLQDMPNNTDIYLLHFNGINFKGSKIGGIRGKYMNVSNFSGLMAYYITPKAAKLLARYALPMDAQIDTYVPRLAQIHQLNIRTQFGNRLSFVKAARDNFKSTLGNNHLSSQLLLFAGLLILFFLIILVMAIIWGVREARFRQVTKKS
jgi:GR25 family glycosyltransferase involved in LPS biosynthesis